MKLYITSGAQELLSKFKISAEVLLHQKGVIPVTTEIVDKLEYCEVLICNSIPYDNLGKLLLADLVVITIIEHYDEILNEYYYTITII